MSFNRGSDGVFHAPQNLEKGGHGISPRTMHHLKFFLPDWKAFCFAQSLIFVECRINFRVAITEKWQIYVPMMQIVG